MQPENPLKCPYRITMSGDMAWYRPGLSPHAGWSLWGGCCSCAMRPGHTRAPRARVPQRRAGPAGNPPECPNRWLASPKHRLGPWVGTQQRIAKRRGQRHRSPCPRPIDATAR